MTLRELFSSTTNFFVGESKFTGELHDEDDLLIELGTGNDTMVSEDGIVNINDVRYILYEMVPVEDKYEIK